MLILAIFVVFMLVLMGVALIANKQTKEYRSRAHSPYPTITLPHSFTPTPTPSPTLTPHPVSPTSPPLTGDPAIARLTFSVKLSNVPLRSPVGSTPVYIPAEVEMSLGTDKKVYSVSLAAPSDQTNIFTLKDPLYISMSNPSPSTYTIFVKSSVTLRRSFANVLLTPGELLSCPAGGSACGEFQNYAAKPLLSGDSDGFNTSSGSYNRVDIADFAKYLSERSGNTASRTADFNLDGTVNTADLGILARNFNKVGD